jgi:tripartite-type tricarboxylate transporter receptor subunit TctC
MLPVAAFSQSASEYPAKPVRVQVSQAPGGLTDILARMFSGKLAANTGRQFIVENRPGAGNTLAPAYVAKSAPDGYTLLVVTPSFTFASAFRQDLPYDTVRDFSPISLLTRAPYLLIVNAKVEANSVQELLALAKTRPGKFNFGGTGGGSANQLSVMLLLSSAKIKAQYVPYKGGGPAMVDLVAGRIDATIGASTGLDELVKAGKLRLLAVTTAQRSKLFPGLPTIAEQGVPGYDVSTFNGWVAPAKTPSAVISKLNAELLKALKDPEVSQKLVFEGSEPVGTSSEEFRQIIAKEVVTWGKLASEIDKSTLN